MILHQVKILQLRFKLVRKNSSYFELINICSFESNQLITKHSNNFFTIGKIRKIDKLDCSTPYFRIKTH